MNPSVLVLRGGAIGDFVLTGPVFDAIRAHWPHVRIELAGYPRIADMARRGGWADTFRSLDHPAAARLFAAPPVANEPLDLSDWGAPLAGFDRVLCYLNDPDGIVELNLKRAGARLVVSHPPLPRQGHAADHLLAPLATWDCPLPTVALPVLRWPDAALTLPAAERARVVIHPGSGSAAKTWPWESFLALARRLSDTWAPHFLFGEADEAKKRLFRESGGAEFAFFDNLPLDGAADLLRTSVGYVGNDSGITHLAAALGVPTVALFGPSDPAVWGPRGPHVRILAARPATTDALARIAPSAVEQACRLLLPAAKTLQQAD